MSNNGYKTKQQQAILKFLMNNQDSHVTVSQISDYLETENTHVGVTTIYRHLDKLLEKGLVRKYTVDGTTSACFQYSNLNAECKQHFHLKCEKCGKLIHLNCSHAAEMCRHIYDEHGFGVDLFRTVFYGICSECSTKSEHNKEMVL